jgi:hypothetical protein
MPETAMTDRPAALPRPGLVHAAAALLTLALLAGCAQPGASPASAHGHEHDHDGHAAVAAPTLDDGRKWAIDAPLRTGMEGIQALVAATGGQVPDAGQATTLAAGIRDQIGYLFANCRLEPRADAVLHALLADLVRAADDLAGDRAAGIARIRDALAQYPRYFDHPGWPDPAGGR